MHTIILYNGSPGYYPPNWLNFMSDLVESNYKVFEWNKLSNIDKQQKINSELANFDAQYDIQGVYFTTNEGYMMFRLKYGM